MRSPSRMIVALVLGFGLAVAAGCGSKPGSAPGGEPGPDQQGNTQPNTDPKPAPAAGPATYETDVAKHAFPAGQVSGVLAGEAVTGEARLEGKTLILRKAGAAPGDNSWQAWIDLPPEAQRGEACRVVVPLDKSPGVSVFVEFPKPVMLKQWELFSFQGWEPMKFLGWQGGCAMTLELAKREKGKMAGKVFLALGEIDAQDPAHRKSYLAGTFEADCPRQPTDAPGVEDVPFVNGSVTVRGAPADATLRAGYAAAPTDKTFPLGATEIQLGEPVNPPRWSQANPDPPRVTNLIAGNGKDVPSRYEHSKLSPGRYLVFAQLKDGPAAWKWVTVQGQSTIAVDLVIDAAQVGGVEVSVPLGVLGKVQMNPAEEPGQPPVGPELFLGIAFQMNLERDIIVNKALFKNLAPGKYEVRAGGRTRLVEIVAGKTLELDLDKPEGAEPKK
jgi:hypothetical protein